MKFESLSALEKALSKSRAILVVLASAWINEQEYTDKIKASFIAILQATDASSLQTAVSNSNLPITRNDTLVDQLVRQEYMSTTERIDERLTKMLALLNQLHLLLQLETLCRSLPRPPEDADFDFFKKASRRNAKNAKADRRPNQLGTYQQFEAGLDTDFAEQKKDLQAHLQEGDLLVAQAPSRFRQVFTQWLETWNASYALVTDDRNLIRYAIDLLQLLPWHQAHQQMRLQTASASESDESLIEQLVGQFQAFLQTAWDQQKTGLTANMAAAEEQMGSTAKMLASIQGNAQTRAAVQSTSSIYDPWMGRDFSRQPTSHLFYAGLLRQFMMRNHQSQPHNAQDQYTPS